MRIVPRRITSAALGLLFGVGWESAHAQPAVPGMGTAEATLIAFDSEEIIVDLGSTRGASDGEIVELWRPLRLRHPVTGQMITDRFLIGKLKLIQVRPTMSLAVVEGKPTRTPAAGDVVILRRAAPPPPLPTIAPATTGGTATPPQPTVVPTRVAPRDAEASQLNDLMVALKGASPSARVDAYESYVYAYPQGRYAAVLWEEAAWLRKLSEQKEQPAAARPTPTTLVVVAREPEPERVRSFAAPARSLAGAPIRLAVELGDTFKGAVLHVRHAGDPAYESLPMTASGPGYFSATVPPAIAQAPSIDFFIEGVAKSGTPASLVGDVNSPTTIPIEDVAAPAVPRKLLMTASILTDFASFNVKKANDYVFQTEGYVGVRLADEGFRALRSGFGVFRGEGGTLRELDQLNLSSRSVGLTYGYLEAEYAFVPTFSVAARAIIGLREDGVNGGALGFFRVGSDLKTNLLLGAEVLAGIGVRGITQLEWATIPRFPILIRAEVTNQPAGVALPDPNPNTTSGVPTLAFGQAEIGVRTIVQVGYQVTDKLTLALRASYQGRTINHAGPGAGAAVKYEW